MTDKKAGTANDTAQELAASVAGVIDAALGVGVSLARVVAQATAPGKPIDTPPASTPPIQAMVQYGVTALGNVASAVVAGADGLRKAGVGVAGMAASGASAAGAGKAARTAAAKSGGPRVQPGATLRVPLSVENPGERPMRGLSPRVRAVRRNGEDALALLPAETIKFSPGLFDVAPRDFEKLTVLVPVPADAPEGAYEIILALGPNEPDLPMAFTVLKAAAPDAI